MSGNDLRVKVEDEENGFPKPYSMPVKSPAGKGGKGNGSHPRSGGKGGKKNSSRTGGGKGGKDKEKAKRIVPCSAYAYALMNNKPPKCLEMLRWNGGLNCAVGMIHHKFEFELRDWHTKYQEENRIEIKNSVLIEESIKTLVLGDERYEWCVANSTISGGSSLPIVPCSMRHEINPSQVRELGYLGSASHVSTAEGINQVGATFGLFSRFIFLGYASLTNTLRNQQASLFSDHTESFETMFKEHIDTRFQKQQSKSSFEDLLKDPEKLQHEQDMFLLFNFKINRAVYYLKKLAPLLEPGGVGILVDETYVATHIFHRLRDSCKALGFAVNCCQLMDFDYLVYPCYYPGPSIANRVLKTMTMSPNPAYPNAVKELIDSLVVDERFFSEDFYVPNPKHPKPHILNFSEPMKGSFTTGGICTDPRKSESDPMFDAASISQETLALKNRLAQKRTKAAGSSNQPPPGAPPKKRIKPPVAVLADHIDVDADSDTDVKQEAKTSETGDIKPEPYVIR